MLIPMNKEGREFAHLGGDVGCLLLHGFTGTTWAMRDLGDRLAKEGMTVFAPLLPGHGTSPEDLIGIPWKSWLACAEAGIQRLEKCRFRFVIGHSMGGCMALILAARFPIQGIVTLSTPIRLTHIRYRLIPFIRPFVKYWKKKSHSGNAPEMAYDRYPLAGVAQFLKLLRATRKILSQVRCPVLILHARDDRRIPSKNARYIYQHVRSEVKRQLFFNDPCHTIMKGKDQEQVEEEVVSFVRSHSR